MSYSNHVGATFELRRAAMLVTTNPTRAWKATAFGRGGGDLAVTYAASSGVSLACRVDKSG
jgi:hypothetical protein